LFKICVFDIGIVGDTGDDGDDDIIEEIFVNALLDNNVIDRGCKFPIYF